MKNVGTAIEKGWNYLKIQNNNGLYNSYIGVSRNLSEPNLSPPETSNILIAEVLLKHHPETKLYADVISRLNKNANQELLTFFEDRGLYPPDSDVNAVGYSLLFESGLISDEIANKHLSVLSSNTDENGIVQVWICDDDRPKNIDHVVATNIIYYAYLLGQEQEVSKSIKWVYEMLQSKKYLEGSRYYISPIAFLFALNRVANKFPNFNEFNDLLYKITELSIGKVEYPIDIAMIVIIAKSLGISSKIDRDKLISIQNEDGSWPADALFRYGSQNKNFGSKALTTAYAIRALEL